MSYIVKPTADFLPICARSHAGFLARHLALM
jgi:hypothetical protein